MYRISFFGKEHDDLKDKFAEDLEVIKQSCRMTWSKVGRVEFRPAVDQEIQVVVNGNLEAVIDKISVDTRKIMTEADHF
jgi:hypothetical protein